MPVINKSAITPYTQQQMYDLVNDVAKYYEFVPWCVGSDVLSQNEDEVRATLSFSRGGLQKSFTTMNRLQPHKMIEIRLIDGPFRQLQGFWRFEPVDQGQSRVALDLEFEFSTRWVALMFGPAFQQIASMLVDCFTQRADDVYA